MSQNFSRMSDIYVPELMELDSYWQKAVEDAIYDTLKGEKRLYYALRNRKKINKKLQRLGLKPVYSQMSFSGRCRFEKESKRKNQELSRFKSNSNTECDSYEKNSVTSFGSCQEEDDVFSQGNRDFGNLGSGSGFRSRSRSKNYRETPPDKKYRNPERPLLGDGSLEKMKKSQNSFNCEPMGFDEKFPFRLSESEGEDEVEAEAEDDPRETTNTDDRNKKIEWLHMREGSAFDESDTETSNHEPGREIIDRNGFKKHPTVKDMNYFMNKKMNASFSTPKQYTKAAILNLEISKPSNSKQENSKPMNSNSENVRIPMRLDPQEDLFWENEVKTAIRENAGLERKLLFALAKREIVNDNLKGLSTIDSNNVIQVDESQTKNAAKRRQITKVLSPFIRFYLEVYRELCHKCPVRQIAREAAARWRAMTVREKVAYGSKSSKKLTKN